MNRRYSPAILSGCVAFALLTGTTISEAADRRANVLFIAVDDLRPELTGFGAEKMATPNFDRLAERYDTVAGDFATGQARQRAASQLLPAGYTIADVGCGTGYVAGALTALADRLILVDASEGMLEEAARRLRDALSDLGHWQEFDYIIFNDRLDEALAALAAVVRGAGEQWRSDCEDVRVSVERILAGAD